MNTSKYRVFLKVAELGNITRAAEELNYTQSGVSQIIGSLERELGFPLLVRTKSGTSLTSSGERVLEPIRQIVKWEASLQQIATSILGLNTGVIRLGTFVSVSTRWLPPIMREFSAQHPNIQFELVTGDYDDILQMLQDNQLDCGFVSGHNREGLDYYHLLTDEYVVILPQDHPYAQAERITFDMLNGQPFIIPTDEANFDLAPLLQNNDLDLNITYRIKEDYTVISMVEHGLGISVLPQLLLEAVHSDVVVKHFADSYSRDLGIAVRSMSSTTPPTRAFVEFVIRWVREQYPQQPEVL
ncbi:MAG: LysR family transcriptional regulator [Oscillospiraceae bacterium]